MIAFARSEPAHWSGKGEMLTQVERISKKVILAAGLRPELTFTSFGRHGRATEASTSGLTEAQLMNQGQWSSTKVKALPPSRRRGQTGRTDQAHQAAQAGGQKVNILSEWIRRACRNGNQEIRQVLENIGAGEGNRTLVFSLEGCCSTIELHPRAADYMLWQQSHCNRAGKPHGGSGGPCATDLLLLAICASHFLAPRWPGRRPRPSPRTQRIRRSGRPSSSGRRPAIARRGSRFFRWNPTKNFPALRKSASSAHRNRQSNRSVRIKPARHASFTVAT